MVAPAKKPKNLIGADEKVFPEIVNPNLFWVMVDSDTHPAMDNFEPLRNVQDSIEIVAG